MTTALIRETYEIVTPESAENGDTEDRGWIDEEGTPYTFREAFSLLRHTEPSSTWYHPGVWYTNYEHGEDFRTGARESRSYHLTASESFQRRLFAALQAARRK